MSIGSAFEVNLDSCKESKYRSGNSWMRDEEGNHLLPGLTVGSREFFVFVAHGCSMILLLSYPEDVMKWTK